MKTAVDSEDRDYTIMRNLTHAAYIRAEGQKWIDWSMSDEAQARGAMALTHQEMHYEVRR